ncbi:unnamed protein product [Blepharisma stoltei]|uniref:Cytochrome b5 heme-binding domain-containing protein n=1 Tax=Blepharisma stoltei TaxID=1481888 RepID=A0AAU9JSW0_9CILI|nr:unnamed protein product [Blepharisma stoltei]
MDREEPNTHDQIPRPKPRRNYGFLRQKDKGAKPQSEFIRMNQSNANPLNLPPGALPLYSLDEIREHRKVDDCWMVFENKVYDITQYIRYHPGGNKIMQAAGMDGTRLFMEYHPWVNYSIILGKYQIGYLLRN